MNPEIITEYLHISIYGFSGTAVNKDYAGTAFQLSGKMWQVVKNNGLRNKGKNIWVYEAGHKIFAGVELEQNPDSATGLEQKNIHLKKYAYYKHIGPYSLIKQFGESVTEWLKKNGYETMSPYIEIYGHWTNDETKAETELFFNLKWIQASAQALWDPGLIC